MTIIEAKVTDQLLTVTNDPVVASGGVKDTSVLFSFCEKWNGFIKTAVFTDATKQDWYDVVLDANNKAIVPAQVMATKGRFWFGVVGVKDDIKYTAKIVQYDVAEGAAISGEEPEIPQSTIDQILAAVGAHTESTSNPHNVTKEQIGLGNVDNNITNVVNANSGRISNHEKRLTNLEARISQEDFVEDSDVAYIKDVPTNACPYAELTKLGGMTRKCGNLISFPYTHTNKTENGITWTVNADGSVTANGTATADSIFMLSNYNTKVSAGTYAFSGIPANGSTTTFIIQTADKNGFAKNNINASGDVFTLTSETSLLFQLVVFNGYTANNLVFKPMLNAGNTALPYEPYFEGLRSAPVTEIESVGANLTTAQEVYKGANRYLETTLDGRKVIRFCANIITNNKVLKFKENTQYTVIGWFKNEKTSESNATANAYITFFYTDGTSNSGTIAQNADWGYYTFTSTNGKTVEGVGLSVYNFTSDVYVDVDTFMFNEGATALPYAPYTKNTLPIPEEVRNLDGYGEGIDTTYQNVLDFEKTRYIQWVRRLSQSEKQLKAVTDYSYSNIVFYQLTKTGTVDKGKATSNILVSNFPVHTGSQSWDSADRIGTVTGASTYDWYWFGFPIGTTLEQAQSVINDCDIVVTLSAAKITDISDILSADNLIAVEGGGTLTFKNDNEFAVPSTVVYQVKSEVNV